MKYCTNCGKEIPENEKFCPYCGAASLEYQPTDETGMSTTAALSIKPGAFSFSGRARRSDYWMCALVTFLVHFPFLMVFFDWIGEFYEGLYKGWSLPDPPSPDLFLLWCVIAIPLFFWGLAVQVRRCHDLGWSGWFLLLPLLCNWLGVFVFQLFLGCKDGQSGPNRFGPDPKGRPAPSRDGTAP